jgi:tRNA threonylcarbamoyladenosine biosynthesis protein TsaB
VGAAGRPIALRSARAPSSATLLRQIDECLEECGLRPVDLVGLVALRGPGSFTGLRVGLSTVLGLRAALEIPATTFGNLEAMAAAVPAPGRVLAVADALRGEWLVQLFAAGAPPYALAEARLARPEAMAVGAPDQVIGFDVGVLAAAEGWPGDLSLTESPALAPLALALASSGDIWDASGLTHPVYLRPPVPVPVTKS